ncbi:unnamed protein product [Mytilus coruscus]|uniref:Zinc finger PHD-type domain-containing protein n=1 Tax=Mytilus coruscus TaxID=42192 RepID=A0A6J8B9I7_MYTCO|nr:unnamed protein product [Mytilus coruscus]
MLSTLYLNPSSYNSKSHMSTSKFERSLGTETPNLHGIKQYTPILLADSKGYQLYNQRYYNTVEKEIQWWGDSGYTTADGLQYTKRNINRAIRQFAENVLPIILELITSNESELGSINNNIQRSLQPTEVNQWSNISPNKDNTNVTGPRITQNSLEYTQISQAEVQQNVTIYFCPTCNKRAGTRTVAYEQRDEWIHFNCAGLKKSDIDKIRDNPFVCRLRIENNLYSTEMVHNNTSINNTVKEVLHLDQQDPAIEFPKKQRPIYTSTRRWDEKNPTKYPEC